MPKTVLASIFAATLLGALPAAAQPAGVSLAQPLSLTDTDQPSLVLVSGGCGPAFHRGPFGGCRRNFGGGFYRPYGYRRFGYGYRRFGYGYRFRR